MGILKATPLGAPGSYGLNTQDSLINLSPLFAVEAYNAIVDEEGRLAARKGFDLLGSTITTLNGNSLEVIYNHYQMDGTYDIISGGNGNIYNGTANPTVIWDGGFGYQVVNVGGAKTGASATGLLNDATVYAATITVDGVNKTINVTGSAAQTYTTLLAEINTDLGAAGTAFLYNGNIKVRSATSSASSSVSISNGSPGLFSTLTGWVGFLTANTPNNSINNWQFATLNGKLFAAQGAIDIIAMDEADNYETVTVSHSAFTNPNTILSAYGRLWAADCSNNDYTFYWSVLQNGADFNGTGSGSLDMTTVFVDGKDSIISLAAHNNRLIVFCQKAVYIFNLGADLLPTDIFLEDTIQKVGCVSRDSVVSTGDDILWLSSVGVQSLKRRTQYETLPLTDTSRLVHQSIINRLVTVEDLTKVRGFYYPSAGWYLLTAPSTYTVWCFNMSIRVPEMDTPRVTQWLNALEKLYAFTTNPEGQLLAATLGGVHLYTGYGSTQEPYTLRLTTGWLSMEDPTVLKHFKKVLLTLRGGSGQTGVLSWAKDFKDQWQGVSFIMGAEEAPYEYNESEYNDLDDAANPGPPAYPADYVDAAFYTQGNLIEDLYMNIGGSAKFIRFRIEVDIRGEIVSLYNMTSFDTRGKVR